MAEDRPTMPDPTPARLTERTLRELLRTATRAATEVGALVLRRARRTTPVAVRRKGEGDFVTGVDVAAERRLRRLLLADFPDADFLGEEGGARPTGADLLWVVDPIDGTSNFVQGLPNFAVAVACLHRGAPVVAAAHCAPAGVTYSAALGLGAWCGQRRLEVPDAALDDRAVIGVQWVRCLWEPALLEPVCRSGARVRTLGSTVTQLCDVAAGRLHANVQTQGRVWDIAAPALIVVEAGGVVSDWSGRPIFPLADPFADRHYPSVAAPPTMHRTLIGLLNGAVVSPP